MSKPSWSRRTWTPALVVVLSALASVPACRREPLVSLGFWFEDVAYRSSRLGGALSPAELTTVARVARTEIEEAFAGLRFAVTDGRGPRYRVKVVQQLQDPRFRGGVAVAGASTAISILGGDGAVNFTMLAAYAESYASPDADRATIVAAIGRGIGRAAVHEFTHQLLGSGRFDDTADRRTYEYGSAARPEQYYGEVHWGPAWPELRRRFGRESR